MSKSSDGLSQVVIHHLIAAERWDGFFLCWNWTLICWGDWPNKYVKLFVFVNKFEAHVLGMFHVFPLPKHIITNASFHSWILIWHLGPVHTYPDIFESATFSFRIRLPSTRIRRIRQRIRKKINRLSKVEKNISATNPITCGRVNPDIFLSDDVKSVSSLSPNNREF